MRPAALPQAERARIPFRSVNRRGSPHYDAELHRHHVIPRQIPSMRCFAALVDHLGSTRIGLHDFRLNGMLLPASESAVMRTFLPLHRGPHRAHSTMVIERVGAIEGAWSRARLRDGNKASCKALQELGELRDQMRLLILDTRRPLVLSRKDPLGSGADFAELDAMADDLWAVTA